MRKFGKLLGVGLLTGALLTQTGCEMIFGKWDGYWDAGVASEWLAETSQRLGSTQLSYLRSSDTHVSAGFIVNGQVTNAYTGDKPAEWTTEPLDIAGAPIELAEVGIDRLIGTANAYFPDCENGASFQVVQSGYAMHSVTTSCGVDMAFNMLDGTPFHEIDVDSVAGLADAIDRVRRNAPDQAYWAQFVNSSEGSWLEAVYADPNQPPVELFFQGHGVNSSSHTEESGPTFSLAQLDAARMTACLDSLGESGGGAGVWEVKIRPGASGLEYTWNLKGGWTAPKSYIVTDANCVEIG